MKKQIILYGAGLTAQSLMNNIVSQYKPVCFVDSDTSRYDTTWCGLPVMALDDALNMWPDADILVTVFFQNSFAIIDVLAEKGIPGERIINVQAPLEYRWGCFYLERYVAFWGDGIALCCGLAGSKKLLIRGNYWGELSGKELHDHIANARAEAIRNMQSPNTRPEVCSDCGLLRQGYMSRSGKISNINLSIEAPCNFHCEYRCKDGAIYNGAELDNGSKLHSAIEYIKYLDSAKITDELTTFWFAVGEPSINPLLGETLDAIGMRHVTIASNGSVYSERIARQLRANSCTLRVSIDAGNAETFAKVRGVKSETFDIVLANIRRYAETAIWNFSICFYPAKTPMTQISTPLRRSPRMWTLLSQFVMISTRHIHQRLRIVWSIWL
jgi:uncharacterized Fe-S cluster-containing radical SAM superfamily protein